MGGPFFRDDLGFTIENIHGCERNTQCQEECLWSDLPPKCLFGDILGWLSAQTLAELKRVKDSDYVAIRNLILNAALQHKSWCVSHGQDCVLKLTHVNISGTPCIHHSTHGKREGLAGKSNKIYYVWIRQRLSRIYNSNFAFFTIPKTSREYFVCFYISYIIVRIKHRV